MVSTGVVRLSDAHRVVGEVDIAVIALRIVSLDCNQEVRSEVRLTEELGHTGTSLLFRDSDQEL